MAAKDDKDVHDGANDTTVDDMTVIQLKDELKLRKLRTTGNKAELVKRLQTALFLEEQKDDKASDDKNDARDESRESDDESSEQEKDGHQSNRSSRREKCLLTFKDVEDSIDIFSGDHGKNVKQWIEDFDETETVIRLE